MVGYLKEQNLAVKGGRGQGTPVWREGSLDDGPSVLLDDHARIRQVVKQECTCSDRRYYVLDIPNAGCNNNITCYITLLCYVMQC